MFLKVAHNRLIELPSVLALLQNLESLDVSNNRLTTLDPIDLSLMPRLQILNLQVLLNIALLFEIHLFQEFIIFFDLTELL